MLRINTIFVACLVGWWVVGMAGCRSSVTPFPQGTDPVATPVPSSTPVPSVVSQPALTKPSSPRRKTAIANSSQNQSQPVTVNIYAVDGQCLKLVPKKVGVSAQKSLEAAIVQILANNDSADFSVSRYRITVRNGVATVDLQPAGTRRSLRSLSTCEQLALFGSIQKTLTSNPRWRIHTVRFTQKGKAIVF